MKFLWSYSGPTGNFLSTQHSLAHRCQKSVGFYLAYSQFAILETVLGHILQLLTWVQSDFNIRETHINTRKKPHGSNPSLHISQNSPLVFKYVTRQLGESYLEK